MSSNKNKKPILIFDWDGVIVDSNAWKWEGAWKEVFSEEPLLVKITTQILSDDADKTLNRYQLIDETLARADKQGILPLYSKKEYADLFGKAVRDGVVHIGLFPGVKDVLKQLHFAGYRMYVISATLQKDLEYIARELSVEDYFVEIYGLPGNKLEHADTICSHEKANAEYIVVGDGNSDRELAKEIGCPFIGIANKWNGWEVTDDKKIVSRVKDITRFL